MKRVILIGYMGSGKTTLGKEIAQKLDLEFIDLDWYIERRFRKSIAELFAQHEETGFRKIEKEMLHEVAEFEQVLISAGGGTPCFFDNMEYMNRQALTVYLNASPTTLLTHLKMGKGKRPLIAQKTDDELMDFIKESLDKRTLFYEQAQILFDPGPLTNNRLVEESVSRLEATIRQYTATH